MPRRLGRIITRVSRLIYLIRLYEIRAYTAVSISITTTIRHLILIRIAVTIIITSIRVSTISTGLIPTIIVTVRLAALV